MFSIEKVSVKKEVVDMNLQLSRPQSEDQERYMDYLREWADFGGEMVPFSCLMQGKTFEDFLNSLELAQHWETVLPGKVPSTLFLLVDETRRIYGALSLRHTLNDYLLQYGGHIGYGIRPKERGHGYAKVMLHLGLEEAKRIGIQRALVTCDASNRASAGTILANGGVFENTVMHENTPVERYWITIL